MIRLSIYFAMTDEHALIKERERAHLAQQLIDNPLWSEFFETLETNLIKSWKDAKSTEYREDAWRHVNVMTQLRKYVEETIRTGKMAENALAEMQRKSEVKRRWPMQR